jgi:NAD(P)-dependent dehydrogenase (short-subunit alcohol dehydrogenase family)
MATAGRDAKGPVLITGCSSGIGLATALHLARRGWPVIAGVKSEAEKGSLPEAIAAERLGVEIATIDVDRDDTVEAAIASIAARRATLAALVNNAGIGSGGFFEDLDEDELRAIFETNFFGTARVTRRALPLLRAGAPSAIVTVSSMAGRIGLPGMSAYHASKFALEGLFESLRFELAPHGVSVTLVEPGVIRTGILAGTRLARRFDDPRSVNHARASRLWEGLKRRVERTAKPPEIVALAIERILLTPRPPLRVPVGADARIILGLQKLLPERLMIGLWGRLAG